MIDGFGRRIDYLRISVTDWCNLRCVYCMPEEKGGGTLAERPEGQEERELESGEILALVRLLAGMGIEKIKLTGGEPLLYPGIENLAGELKQISGISQVTLTTNGILLAEKADALEEAGIDGINLSLDTLDPEVFFAITRRRGFARVMEGFQRILEGGENSAEGELCAGADSGAEGGGSGRVGPKLSGGGAVHRDDAHRGGAKLRESGRRVHAGTFTGPLWKCPSVCGRNGKSAPAIIMIFRDFPERWDLSAQ